MRVHERNFTDEKKKISTSDNNKRNNNNNNDNWKYNCLSSTHR